MKKIYSFGALGICAALLAACGSQSDSGASSDSSSGASETADSVDQSANEEVAEQTPTAESIDTVDGTSLADFTGDPAAGERVFLQCQACHTLDPGVNRVGPSLAGVAGKASGTAEGFNYSDANINSGITWSPEKLNQFLENPRRVVPGTRMAFAGLKDGQDRADIIAYLQAN